MQQVLEPVFEPDFQRHSYGLRPNRNAHQAVEQAHWSIKEGYQHVIDIDLKSFFDQVDHAILLELIHRKVKCRLTMKLLRAPMPINREKSGIRHPSTFDIPGYHFVPVFKKGVKGQYQLVVSAKSWKESHQVQT
ncbi:MAG: hypothetical protein LAT67_12260 [Balneolales bacterium]|nr:hypothetical protein [Balneolales bacterium]